MQTISTKQLAAILNKQTVHLLDVREPDEFQEGHIPAAHNYPLSEIVDWLPSLAKNQHYYLVCRSGNRSRKAAAILTVQGYWATNVAGGMLSWHGETTK